MLNSDFATGPVITGFFNADYYDDVGEETDQLNINNSTNINKKSVSLSHTQDTNITKPTTFISSNFCFVNYWKDILLCVKHLNYK
jgi:hypothetical protein